MSDPAADSAAESGSVSQPLPHNATLVGLPIFLSEQASDYGTFTVGVIDERRHVALTDPPPTTAWSRHLLEEGLPDVLSWDGRTIRMTLENGSWVWVAEGQSPYGDVIFGRWPD